MKHPDLKDLAGKRVLVTGAASGIGRATAQVLARRHAELFLIDIDGGALEEVAGELREQGASVPFAVKLDVVDDDAVVAFAGEVHDQGGPLDVVMNIAGISTWGSVDRLTTEHWHRQVEVNLLGPIHVIHAFVPEMMAAGRGGHLVNVASAAALIGLPRHAAYSASKFGLRGVSEVLRFDLAPYRIGVSLVCPGAVRTKLVQTVEIVGVDANDPGVIAFKERFAHAAVSPEKVADAMLDAVARNRYLVFTSGDVRFIHLLQRTADPLYAGIMGGINRLAGRVLAKAER